MDRDVVVCQAKSDTGRRPAFTPSVLGGREGSVEDFGWTDALIDGHGMRGSFRRSAVCASRSPARAAPALPMAEAGGFAFSERAL